MRMAGLAAVVTGAASGLGLGVARMLEAQGAQVALLDRNEELGRQSAAQIGGLFVHADVTDPLSVDKALSAAAAVHGPARILVNCAGIAPAGRTVSKDGTAHSPDLFRQVITVNLLGTFNMLSRFAAACSALDPIDGECGVIINTASVAAFDGQIGQAAYAASKAGVAGMTLPVARDLANSRIRVMAIAPGVFLTPMVEAFPQAVQDALGAQVPHPSRLGRPEEFAGLVRQIIENPMLNGEVIRLDGAIRMAPR